VRFDDPALREVSGLQLFLFGPGTGESIALRSEGSGWIVIDSLQRRDGHVVVNPALELVRADDAELSCVVLTHPHADHAGGVADLVALAMESNAVVSSVDEFIRTPRDWDADPVIGEDTGAVGEYGKVETATAAIRRSWRLGRAIPWKIVAGDSMTFGDVRLTALWPDQATAAAWNGRRSTANTVSTPHLVEWHDLRLLLGADLPCAQWRQVAAEGHGVPLHEHGGCKLPHHGSIGAREDVWAAGQASRSWALAGYSNGDKKLPDLAPGGGAETLLEDVERLALTALPFATHLPAGAWSLTPAAALRARRPGRESAQWGTADEPPRSGPMDGWVKLTFQPDGSADVQLGNRAVTLVRPHGGSAP
jgi:beta-lactamase superfamily II metal-dependent hydrolase